ncbi:MAG TPA: hypothetical protein PK079_16835 [Leptospiraceae bacterium]|nr:hypothetical protein [Leptospiraceae bacterium]HMW06104.1 hypothetical protein [Leptospiraceae bacterium]HMX30768.1 hypothetical protein [Leptospiraceae bacterium]HMY31765.1 hypothetical protein [Leptospiraceae bacterium]HMZ63096.1 hypothetical protein [Leptospiraceae bacterium]
MKIKLIKNLSIFNILISLFLIISLIPLNLANPEEDYSLQSNTEYSDVISDYSLYSTMRVQSRAGDINDQYFSDRFYLVSIEQFHYDDTLILEEDSIPARLLCYRLISLPPPTV